MQDTQNWYVRRDQKVLGPFPAGLISRYILIGRIRASDEVSQDRKSWLPVVRVRGLVPDVIIEARRNPDDPEAQERLAAARRWADERRDADSGQLSTGERRSGENGDLAGHRDVVSHRPHEEAEALVEKPARRIDYLIIIVILAGLISLPFILPSQETDDTPDCKAAPAPGINWSNCKLERAVLINGDLEGAVLKNANLTGAMLRGANLMDGDLSYINLSQANLRGANLQGANLKGANLRGADLRNAILIDSDFSYADLTGADMANARIDGLHLGNAIINDNTVCLPGSVGTCRTK